MPYHIIKNIIRLNDLIRIKATGTPRQLAKKLNVSERTLYSYLTLLKNWGAPVKYSRFKNSYYYEDAGNFQIGFKKE